MIEITTVDLLSQIISNIPAVKEIFIHSYPTPSGLEKRILFGQLENQQFKEALEFRQRTKIGFWDSLMFTFYEREEYSIEILEKMLNHHVNRKKFSKSRQQVFEGELKKYQEFKENYALNSLVNTVDGKQRHFVLLDFRIPETDKNQNVVESLLRVFNLSNGFLLRSGKSYHYISNFIVSKKKLNNILYRALFYSPIIDKYWIAHQLLDNSCSLRISKKNGVFPTLIKAII